MKQRLPRLSADARLQALSYELPERVLARWNGALQAKDDDNTISIYDPIGADFWGEGVTAKRIAAALRTIGRRDVVVNLNSPGGNVFEGVAIYNLLREHEGGVTVRVLGSALSIASIIAMAGDTIQIARAGFMMVHNAWGVAIGNRNDLRETADIMEQVDGSLADVYAARTGLARAAVAKLMDKESWFSGEDAIAQGLADEYLPADQVEQKDKDTATAAAAMRRVDAIMAKQGLPRSERRGLLRQLAGTPGAASDVTPSADEDVRAVVGLLRQYQ